MRLLILSPDCPFIENLLDRINRKIRSINGIETVEVTLLHEPQRGETLSASAQREVALKGAQQQGRRLEGLIDGATAAWVDERAEGERPPPRTRSRVWRGRK